MRNVCFFVVVIVAASLFGFATGGISAAGYYDGASAPASSTKPQDNQSAVGYRKKFGIGKSVEVTYDQDGWRVWKVQSGTSAECAAIKFDVDSGNKFLEPMSHMTGGGMFANERKYARTVIILRSYPELGGHVGFTIDGPEIHLKNLTMSAGGEAYFLKQSCGRVLEDSRMPADVLNAWDGRMADVEITSGKYRCNFGGSITVKTRFDLTGLANAGDAVRTCIGSMRQ